jgi:hypothetical protein
MEVVEKRKQEKRDESLTGRKEERKGVLVGEEAYFSSIIVVR